jgi:hypothetical protein
MKKNKLSGHLLPKLTIYLHELTTRHPTKGQHMTELYIRANKFKKKKKKSRDTTLDQLLFYVVIFLKAKKKKKKL